MNSEKMRDIIKADLIDIYVAYREQDPSNREELIRDFKIWICVSSHETNQVYQYIMRVHGRKLLDRSLCPPEETNPNFLTCYQVFREDYRKLQKKLIKPTNFHSSRPNQTDL